MSDSWRPRWTDRLHDIDPPTPRCSACRGMRLVRGERCPECDGAGTLEAQQAHLAKLAECNADEKTKMTAAFIQKQMDIMAEHVRKMVKDHEDENGQIVVPEAEVKLVPLSTRGLDLSDESILQVVRGAADYHGYELTKLPTFAELMAEQNTMLGRRPRDTEEDSQRILKALQRECDVVVVQHATELFSMLSEAVEQLSERACLRDRMVCWQMNWSTWEALGKPTALLGHHVQYTFPVPPGAILVSAGREGDRMEVERIVLVMVECELSEVTAFVAEQTQLKTAAQSASPGRCECGHRGFTRFKGVCKCSCCGRWYVKSDGCWTLVKKAPVNHIDLKSEVVKAEPPSFPHPRCGELVKAEPPDDDVEWWCLCGHLEKTINPETNYIHCGCGREWQRTDEFGELVRWKLVEDVSPGAMEEAFGEYVDASKRRVVEAGRMPRPTHLSCSCGWLHKDVLGDEHTCSECKRRYFRDSRGEWEEMVPF